MNALIWNISLVNTQRALSRLIRMCRIYHFGFIGLMEPFQDGQKIDEYKGRLGMQHAVVNRLGKIWAFMDAFMKYNIIKDE